MSEVPTTCDCGGEMAPVYEHVGDFWGAPAYEVQSTVCVECRRDDEEVADKHNIRECETEDCGWCALLVEEVRA